MVKNTKGGKGSKSFARKNSYDTSHSSSRAVRLPTDPLEHIAIVTKMYGTICDVTTANNLSIKCHIRSKFRGRSKSVSFISVFKFVLIGLRDYENPPKNCDLLEVYDPNEVSYLLKLPHIDISLLSKIAAINNNNDTTSDSFDFEFSDQNTSLPPSLPTSLPTSLPLTPYLDPDLVDFDDI